MFYFILLYLILYYNRALQDICPERRIFEKEGTVLGDLTLKILLLQSANPPKR